MIWTMGQTGDGTLRWLRERNRQRVLGALREQGRTSQAEIARATGLSRTTVSKVVAELKETGFVDVLEVKASDHPSLHGGRPSVQLALRDLTTAVVGVDFGHSHVQVAVGDVAHNVLAERRCDLDVNHR